MVSAACSLGLRAKAADLRRLQRQAPMQIDTPEARRLFKERQPVVHESLRDWVGVLRFLGKSKPDITRVYW